MFFSGPPRARCVLPCPICDKRDDVLGVRRPIGAAGKRVFLHIGRHKTGSTAIQQTLAHNRDRLRAQGLVYPGSNRCHEAIVYAHQGWHDGTTPERAREARVIRDEMCEADGDLIVSSEGLCRMRPVEVRHWLGDAEATIIVYIREQAEAIASMYQQLVKAGSLTQTFEEFAAPIDSRYRQDLDEWAAVFGRENMRVRLYEAGDVVTDFMQTVGIAPGSLEMVRGDPNPSIAGALLEAKRRINIVYPGSAARLLKLTWRHLLDLAEANPAYRGRVSASDALIERIRVRHRADNAVVTQRYLAGQAIAERPWPPTPSYSEADVMAAYDALVAYAPELERDQPLRAHLFRRDVA